MQKLAIISIILGLALFLNCVGDILKSNRITELETRIEKLEGQISEKEKSNDNEDFSKRTGCHSSRIKKKISFGNWGSH